MFYFLHGKPFIVTPRKSTDNHGVNIRVMKLKTDEEWENDNRRRKTRNRV